ncbi:MAG: hypothetical protein DIU80_014805 [Chloroflexota bacterium]
MKRVRAACALGEAFEVQFLDHLPLLMALFIFRITCAVEGTGFAVNLLLAASSSAILAQLS